MCFSIFIVSLFIALVLQSIIALYLSFVYSSIFNDLNLVTLSLCIEPHETIPEIIPFPGANSERGPIGVFTSHTNLGFTSDEIIY